MFLKFLLFLNVIGDQSHLTRFVSWPHQNPAFEQNYKIRNWSTQLKPIFTKELARAITVRVFPEQGAASGVIIARNNHTYTVITNDHVLQNSITSSIKVMTADGVVHLGKIIDCHCFKNEDLGIIKFNSDDNYQVSKLGSSYELTPGQPLYSAGYPNYQYPSREKVLFTFSWGTKAFQITQGNFSNLIQKSLPRGYQLGYTNKVTDGMSGGAILNSYGELVGINGRLKYPVQGIKAFVFEDGTQPSPQLFEKLQSLSWGIPIEAFKAKISTINRKSAISAK